MSKLQFNNKRPEDHEEAADGKKRRKDDKNTNEVLLNPDILEIVFKDLDITRLKLLRTVCKTWNELICVGMGKREFMSHVQGPRDYSTLMEIVRKSQELQLPQIFQNLVLRIENNQMVNEILSVPLELSVTKLCINEKMDCRSPRSTRWMYALLRNCSSTLKSLKIPLCCVEVPVSAKTSWALKFPLLEKLILTVDDTNLLNCLDDDHHPPESYIAMGSKLVDGALFFFSNLIRSAPKLSSLEIFHNSGSIGKFLRSFDLEKLRTFKFWRNVQGHPGSAEVISRIKFENLTSLSLNSSSGDFDNSNIEQLLQRHSMSLESLSLAPFSFVLPTCPNLKQFAVRIFKGNYDWDLGRFPALNSIQISEVDHSFLSAFHTCPVSLKTVKIRWGPQKFSLIRVALWNLYRLFASSATAWELPYEYMNDFCAFIAAEKGGKGIKSLTIDFDPEEFSFPLLPLGSGLENISKLQDLEELTLKNRRQKLPLETWNSFQPHQLPNLHTLTYFNHSTDFEEVAEELFRKLKPLTKVVLLRNKPVRFDRKAEEFFIKLPNATSLHEERVLPE